MWNVYKTQKSPLEIVVGVKLITMEMIVLYILAIVTIDAMDATEKVMVNVSIVLIMLLAIITVNVSVIHTGVDTVVTLT